MSVLVGKILTVIIVKIIIIIIIIIIIMSFRSQCDGLHSLVSPPPTGVAGL